MEVKAPGARRTGAREQGSGRERAREQLWGPTEPNMRFPLALTLLRVAIRLKTRS